MISLPSQSSPWAQKTIFLREIGKRLTTISGDIRETSFLFQRISVTLQRYNAVAFRGSFRRVPDSQTEVSMEVWFYWALFCGSPGIICTWDKNIIIIITI